MGTRIQAINWLFKIVVIGYWNTQSPLITKNRKVLIMTNQDNTVLAKELENNAQFCIALKTLIQIGTERETVDDLLERLCDRAEALFLKHS
jgi:hypothetical protein